MIAPAGTGSFLMVRGVFGLDGETREAGLYVANVSYGFHVHDDENETFSYVADLPASLSDIIGLSTIVEPGKVTVALLTWNLGLYRGVYDFDNFDGWYADGEKLDR